MGHRKALDLGPVRLDLHRKAGAGLRNAGSGTGKAVQIYGKINLDEFVI